MKLLSRMFAVSALKSRPRNRTRLQLESLDRRDVPAVATWNGSILQENSDGSDPANWMGNVAPSPGDDIVIPKNTGGFTWNTAVVGSVTIADGWFGTWSGNSLTIGGDSDIHTATFNMNAPLTIESGAHVTLDGVKFKEQNPGNGSLVVETLGQINVTGSNRFETKIDSLGLIVINQNAGMVLANGIEFKNRGELRFNGGGLILADTGNEKITNSGIMNLATRNLFSVKPLVNNTGVITITAPTSGLLVFDGGVTNTGIIKLPDGDQMSFNGSGLHSMGGEFQTLDNPTAAVPAASTRGNLWFENTLVTLGYGSTTGKHYLFSRTGSVTMDNSILNVTLNYTNDSIDRWQIDNGITFAGPNTPNTLNVQQIAPPATAPVNKWWTVVESITVSNDFEGWGIGSLSHRKVTDVLTDIQVGFPAAAPAPKPPLAYVSPSSTYPTVVWVSDMTNPMTPAVAYTYDPTFVYNPTDPNGPQVVLVTNMMNPSAPPLVYIANPLYVSNPMDMNVGYVYYTPVSTAPTVNLVPTNIQMEMAAYWSYIDSLQPIMVDPVLVDPMNPMGV